MTGNGEGSKAAIRSKCSLSDMIAPRILLALPEGKKLLPCPLLGKYSERLAKVGFSLSPMLLPGTAKVGLIVSIAVFRLPCFRRIAGRCGHETLVPEGKASAHRHGPS